VNTFEITDMDDVDIDGTAFNAYVESGNARLAVNAVGGLWHLEGETLAALVDGNVVTGLTVTNGTATLLNSAKGSRWHLGLGFVADVETLNPEAPEGTVQGQFASIPTVVVRFRQSRGMLIGPSTDQLTEIKQRQFELMGEPTRLLTGDFEQNIPPEWNSNGRVFIRQPYPLPLHVLAIIPTIVFGDEDDE
jgi:hypothetical protein